MITKVKEILVNPDVNALDLLDMIHNDLTTTDILVFTPKGDQKSIQKGATALDFAYLIHSQIGNKAIAAKVNMRLAPLSYVLKTGDQVEIITAENGKPKREWLDFLQTRKARNLVMDSLKEERQESVKLGKKILLEQLAALGSSPTPAVLKTLMNRYEIHDAKEDELYFRIGIGLIKLNELDDILKNMNNDKSRIQLLSWLKREKKEPDSVAQTNDRYVTATCCSPIPGDSVVGFRSPDGVITIHKKTCAVANNLAAKHGDQIVMPEWSETVQDSFLVRLSLKGLDRIGIINDITRYISLVMSVNIRRLNIETDGGVFEGAIDLYVRDKKDLEKLVKKLEKIEGIQSVMRSEIR